MKLSNLKIYEKDNFGYIECLIDKKNGWLKFDKSYLEYVQNTYDGFLVLVLLIAMKKNQNIEIDGIISYKLYHNITLYLMPLIKIIHPTFNIIKISCKEFDYGTNYYNVGVGCGLSCGVDSLCCLEDYYFNDCRTYNLTHVTNFNAGSCREKNTYENRLININNYVNETNLKLLYVDTNFITINNLDHQYFHMFRNLSVPLFFQKLFKKYYYGSCFSYFNSKIAKGSGSLTSAETTVIPLLSTENLEYILHGAQYTRIEKTLKINNNKLSYKYLDVCISSFHYDNIEKKINCSECYKCLRTLVTLDYYKIIDNYNAVFDMNKYYQHKDTFLNNLVNTNPYDREIMSLYKNIDNIDNNVDTIISDNAIKTVNTIKSDINNNTTNTVNTVNTGNTVNNINNNNNVNNINTINTVKNVNSTNTTNNIWYAYKGDWLMINNNQIKAKKNVFIKKNKDIHTDNLDNNSKKMIEAETIFNLNINQNNNKYYIINN